jgi:hypothetical protein
VGTKVQVRYGHEWAHECWSLKGIYVVDGCCDPFSAGTLTCVKSLETVLRASLSPFANDSE